MTLCFLQDAWRRSCHEPHRQPPNKLTAPALYTSINPLLNSSWLFFSTYSSPKNSFPLFLSFFSFILSSISSFLATTRLQHPFLLTASFCLHLCSPLHPFFAPLFVCRPRSQEGLSDISCASCRFRPHLVRGFQKGL